MGHGDANGDAGIFENVDVLNIRVARQFPMALRPEINHLTPVLDGELGGRERVLRMVEHHVARTTCAGLRIEAGFGRERLAIQLKCREIVGIDQHIIVPRHPA